jgi:tetratricopeptide (TPR) repeat protein
MQRPVFLSGKVILSDGGPPPEPVTIERVCGGINRPEGYTDSKGRFSFQLGQNSAMLADASTSSMNFPGASNSGLPSVMNQGRGISERDLFGCELRAVLPGYRSDVVQLSNRRFLDNPDLGTIVLHRMANVEGLTISATTAGAPKDAKKAQEKGFELAKKGKFDEAQKEFEKAVQLYPQYAVAWHRLGLIYERKNDKENARKAFEESIKSDPKYVSPYERLYIMDAQDNKWQEVADMTEKVQRMNPYDFPTAFYFNAVANLQLNKLEAAEKSAREAIKMDGDKKMPKSSYILGLVLAQKNDFTGAAEHLKNYLQMVPNGRDNGIVRQQLADIEKIATTKTQQNP